MSAHIYTPWLKSSLETKLSSSICRQNQNLCNLLTIDARKCNGLASSTVFAIFEHNPHPHKQTLAKRNPKLKVCSKFTTYCSSNRNSNHFQISEKGLEKSICRQTNTSAPRLKETPPASAETKCISSIISALTKKPSTKLISLKVWSKFRTYCFLDATVTISKAVRITSS